MNCGKTFVDKLKKLGYAHADKLNGEDFDWLFETTDTQSFLEWFCGHVSEQQVLSKDTLKSFNSLKESGKHILDENDLEEVLKTCKAAESRHTSEDEIELEKLQEELRFLQKIKGIKANRCNKLQVMASTSGHMSLKLRDAEEVGTNHLKAVQETLSAENNKMNNELKTLTETLKMMISFFAASNLALGSGVPAVLLSQLSLESYLSQEEQRTSALTSYTKKQFFEGISELIESSNEENFQLLELDESRSCIQDESHELNEQRTSEMARLQLAYICAKQQLVQLKANDTSLEAGLECAKEQLLSLRNKTNEKAENVEARNASLKNELLQLRNQMKHIQSETLPDLVKENAQLLNMPIVKGDFDLQIARQDYYTSRQDLVCSQLMKQKSSFELLHLAYETELRKHRDIHRQLEAVLENLKQCSKSLHQALEMLSDPTISRFSKAKNSIDSKDCTSTRIYQLIEGKNEKQQLFKTYEGLEEVAKKLMHNILSYQDQFAVSSQEQSLIMSKMDADVKTLRDSMYYGESCLLLSAKELTEQFQKLETQMNSVNQLIKEFLGDLKNKKKILETNKLHKMEKQLYVYFFQDAGCLKRVFEQVEAKANVHEKP
ncbi:hypothetical protein NDU88_001458 [Pleurodeles waltl]|uniref:HAUS augmin-like complex subunit 3 N-terminal domain-containing protein n=1 Tax=Pleurodeles waltl TaxID=8319 RepID=A0AAV7WMI0_PLEWA|nr:hypothetical protein NDU88_001458 [Pleurodeles waltl]